MFSGQSDFGGRVDAKEEPYSVLERSLLRKDPSLRSAQERKIFAHEQNNRNTIIIFNHT